MKRPDAEAGDVQYLAAQDVESESQHEVQIEACDARACLRRQFLRETSVLPGRRLDCRDHAQFSCAILDGPASSGREQPAVECESTPRVKAQLRSRPAERNRHP